MTELDRRLSLLQRHARAWAAELAPYSMEVDRTPDAVLRHADLPVFARMAALQIPPEYNPDPLTIDGQRFYLASASATPRSRERIVAEARWCRSDRSASGRSSSGDS